MQPLRHGAARSKLDEQPAHFQGAPSQGRSGGLGGNGPQRKGCALPARCAARGVAGSPSAQVESRAYCLTKAGAIESALDFASGEDGPPRGMLADLQRYGISDRTAPDAWARGAITTIERVRLSDIL